MGFSLPNFLRRTPPAALEDYFCGSRLSGLSGIDWKSKPQLLLDRLLKAIDTLPDEDREHVFDDFERSTQLCDEIGQRALQSVLAHDLLEAVRAGDSHETRALLVLLRDPNAFDQALATAYADRFRNGRSWSGFLLSSRVAPQPDQAGLAALEAEIGGLFKAFDGSGRKLKIESFARRGRPPKARARRRPCILDLCRGIARERHRIRRRTRRAEATNTTTGRRSRYLLRVGRRPDRHRVKGRTARSRGNCPFLYGLRARFELGTCADKPAPI